MNLAATHKLAKQIAHRLKANNGGVVLLHGGLGAGKTTLVREIVQILCPEALPASPTYTIINEYADNIFHADLYRLWRTENSDTPHDEAVAEIMESTGLADLCVAGNYVFIEWPNGLKIPGALEITINVKEDGEREFIVAG